MYLKDSAPLAREEELRLLIKWKRGCKASFERVVKANQRFVLSRARMYANANGGDLDDYYQEAMGGFLHAMTKFDVTRGLKLISYAVNWIDARLAQYAMKERTSGVKVFTTQPLRRLFFVYNKTKEELSADGHEPTAAEIAERLDMDVADVEEYQLRAHPALSLDKPITDDADSATHLDHVESSAPSQDERLETKQETRDIKRDVKSALARLDERERFIIENRFMSEKPVTLVEIGAKYGFSRERARQLELRAREKLRLSLAVPLHLRSEVDGAPGTPKKKRSRSKIEYKKRPGRPAKAERNAAIAAKHKAGVPVAALAKEYDLSRPSVYQILARTKVPELEPAAKFVPAEELPPAIPAEPIRVLLPAKLPHCLSAEEAEIWAMRERWGWRWDIIAAAMKISVYDAKRLHRIAQYKTTNLPANTEQRAQG